MTSMLLALLFGVQVVDAHPNDDRWDRSRRRDVGSTTVFNPEKSVSVTLSPIHLMIPMFEATGEFRTSDQQSLAVIGGIGNDGGQNLYELGGQVRQYVLGDFDTGINLGAEAKWANNNFSGWTDPMGTVGPFLGGKLTVALFTLDVQGGGQVIWQGGNFTLGPLLNVNAGVSF